MCLLIELIADRTRLLNNKEFYSRKTEIVIERRSRVRFNVAFSMNQIQWSPPPTNKA